VAACQDGAVLTLRRSLQLVQGNFEYWRSLSGHGPAPQPAAIAAIVNADDLIERPVFAVMRELDAVALMKVGGGARHGGDGLGLEDLSDQASGFLVSRWFQSIQNLRMVRGSRQGMGSWGHGELNSVECLCQIRRNGWLRGVVQHARLLWRIDPHEWMFLLPNGAMRAHLAALSSISVRFCTGR